MFNEKIDGEHTFRALRREDERYTSEIWTIWADSPQLAWNVMDVIGLADVSDEHTYFEGTTKCGE